MMDAYNSIPAEHPSEEIDSDSTSTEVVDDTGGGEGGGIIDDPIPDDKI